jgi:hypothetical protein
MWLTFPVALLVVLFIIGAIVGGGIFTIVLVPIAVIMIVAAVGFSMWNRAQSQGSGRSHKAQTGDPLPHSGHRNVAPSPSTPDDLVDARQQQQ